MLAFGGGILSGADLAEDSEVVRSTDADESVGLSYSEGASWRVLALIGTTGLGFGAGAEDGVATASVLSRSRYPPGLAATVGFGRRCCCSAKLPLAGAEDMDSKRETISFIELRRGIGPGIVAGPVDCSTSDDDGLRSDDGGGTSEFCTNMLCGRPRSDTRRTAVGCKGDVPS